jgi:hypothetical protein
MQLIQAVRAWDTTGRKGAEEVGKVKMLSRETYGEHTKGGQ